MKEEGGERGQQAASLASPGTRRSRAGGLAAAAMDDMARWEERQGRRRWLSKTEGSSCFPPRAVHSKEGQGEARGPPDCFAFWRCEETTRGREGDGYYNELKKEERNRQWHWDYHDPCHSKTSPKSVTRNPRCMWKSVERRSKSLDSSIGGEGGVRATLGARAVTHQRGPLLDRNVMGKDSTKIRPDAVDMGRTKSGNHRGAEESSSALFDKERPPS